MEMRVVEQMLPGIGMRYEIDVGDARQLYVIVYRDGRRDIGVMGSADEPEAHVALDPQAAVTIAALLLGARFTLDTSSDTWVSSDEAVVEVVELADDSPALGKYPGEIELVDPEAVVLAVMSDSTPELVESETGHRALAGDRVVVAGRAARIAHVTAALRSASPPGAPIPPA
jgi:K+/H+ antiporter YhaU regulatory subunit KhtT